MRLLRFFGLLLALALFLGAVGVGVLAYGFWHYGRGLPDYQQLADYEPPVTTRVHAGDGRLIAEFARERRLFVPVAAMPKRVINAFLSAEDQNFYSHPGIDVLGVLRAVVQNIAQFGQDRRPVGASTITQQVAKNFLLSNEVSIERKIKEAILAFRIERAFTKDRILELYLNEIYLGAGAYGVAAASLLYFDKSLDELSIAEAAYLAALPKAPNNYNPTRHYDRAKGRRDWVVGRMAEDGAITLAEAEVAVAQPLVVRHRGDAEIMRADWFAEEVRRELAQGYGEDSLYEGGLSVRTTVEPKLQQLGERVLRDGLVAYDRRHGWRGPLGHIEIGGDWHARLVATPPVPGLRDNWRVAVVLDIDAGAATVGLMNGSRGKIPLDELKWARPALKEAHVGPAVSHPKDVLKIGDIVAVEALEGERAEYALRQIPEVDGALMAMDPHTGRVLAMLGGWDFRVSQFNRASQAMRQPGSSFKPFVYAAALDHGFTPSSLVLDAPFVIDQGPGLPKWKPGNYSNEFYGPSTLRLGLEKSRNLMTVRLAQAVGMDVVADYARRFGVVDEMPPVLSMALGAAETTLYRMTTAYAQFVNGGKRIEPTLIDRIQDRNGETVLKHDERACTGCNVAVWSGQSVPEIEDDRAQVIDPATAYQIVSLLQGVVERGTGVRIRELDKPLAGKTGTTNDYFDAWFIGFTPDLVVGVYVGFDNPHTLGARETGSSVAVPIFKDFMAEALKDKSVPPFRVPPGIRLVRVRADTGQPARPGDRNVILEAFKPGTELAQDGSVLDGSGAVVETSVESLRGLGGSAGGAPTAGTGGLY